MKKYDRYKDSGIEWIREIPERWTITRLANFGKFYKGRGVSKADLTDSGVPVILYGDIYTKYNIKTGVIERKTSDKVARNSVLIINGDLLFTASGETKEDIGKCICFTGSDEAYAGGDVIIYRQKQNSSLFLSYVFNSHYVVAQKAKLSKGEIVVHIYGSQLRNIFFALPPLSEQVQIVSFLDEKISQIDSLISKKKKLISLLIEERSVIISKAVTKGIDSNIKYRASGIQWIGNIPEHWEVKKLKYVSSIINGNSFKSEDFIDSGECRVIKIANIQTMKIDWSDESFLPLDFYEKFPSVQIKYGDLVFALTRPIISTGIKAAIVTSNDKILLNQRNSVLRPTSNLDVFWMYYIILSPNFIEHFDSLIDNTGQQPNISSNDISNIEIPLPDKKEQYRIIHFLDLKISEIDTIITKTEKEIALISEYKSALINDVVTGKIDVRDAIKQNQDKLQEAHQ